MLMAILIVLALIAIVFLFAFAYMMDKWHGVIAIAVVGVWVWNMQPASAATVKTVTEMDGVRYYDVMTTNPNESYNGVQGRDPRIDRLRNWLDIKCRGGNGDAQQTQDFCTLRDKLN